nr:MAG TPA: hypothetical protein [Caudoviricetes sp.]
MRSGRSGSFKPVRKRWRVEGRPVSPLERPNEPRRA